MIEKHYAGVIEDWDGVQRGAEDQIRAARQNGGRSLDVATHQQENLMKGITCKSNGSRRPESNRGPLHYELPICRAFAVNTSV